MFRWSFRNGLRLEREREKERGREREGTDVYIYIYKPNSMICHICENKRDEINRL